MFDINNSEKMIEIWGSYADFVFEFLELNSGMRNAEVRCLKWKNVDIKGGQISIEETFKDHKDKIIGRPKNGTNRFFIMSDNLKKVLTEYKEKYAPNTKPTDFVFSYKDGSHWGYTHTKNHHMSGLKNAKVEYRKQHTYRHTFNTIFFSVLPKMVEYIFESLIPRVIDERTTAKSGYIRRTVKITKNNKAKTFSGLLNQDFI